GMRDLEKEMQNLLNDPEIIIRVGNDANVAAAGEMYKGVAQGYKNVVMFTIGTGVGGGIIIDGKLVEGVNGSGGELGHIIVDFKHNYPCKCGKHGCLETVASATGIVNIAKETLIKHKNYSPLRRYESFSAKKVIDHAKAGDYISKRVMDESMRYLALAMATVSLTVDPAIVVIGGGVSNAGDYIVELVEKYYYEMVNPFIKKAKISVAQLGNDAGIYGCAYLVKE
ncbi:MAG TPA: ROK family protein, partial [Bacillota bacterium]|nr:ROK family protein [Bacillota bacterium]